MSEKEQRVTEGYGLTRPISKESIEEYVREARVVLDELGFEENKDFLREVVLGFYAKCMGNEETPRIIIWETDSKEGVMTKLRDVICHQKLGKTINQLPKVDEIFKRLSFGIIERDPFGIASAKVSKALISSVWERDDKPIIYFDEIRQFPQIAIPLFNLMEHFEVDVDDIADFDPDFFEFFAERLQAGLEVLETKEPLGEDWKMWAMDENLVWQQYTRDWDDYQAWLEKRRFEE